MIDYISEWDTNEDVLKAMLIEYGPVVTSVNSKSSPTFISYQGGIFDDPESCCDAAYEGADCW